MKPYYIILYLITCITIGATADGLNLVGPKIWGHNFEAIEILLLISGALIFKLSGWRNWVALVLSYTFLRVAGFDYIHNLVIGESWDYLGTSSWWDKVLSRQVPGGLLFGRVIFLIAGISITIKELR